MSIPKPLTTLVGQWVGSNRLYVPWVPGGVHESAGTSTVSERVAGQFIEIAYTWVYEDQTREGVLILGGDNKTDAVSAFWTDSWHMAHQMMMCNGKENENGTISVKGHYKVEGHPEWGWRTEITPRENAFEYKMYNVTPEGEEEIAVEMDFKPA